MSLARQTCRILCNTVLAVIAVLPSGWAREMSRPCNMLGAGAMSCAEVAAPAGCCCHAQRETCADGRGGADVRPRMQSAACSCEAQLPTQPAPRPVTSAGDDHAVHLSGVDASWIVPPAEASPLSARERLFASNPDARALRARSCILRI